MAALSVFPVHATEEAPGSEQVVNYEAFGALGDGKTDDLPAICAAHAHANRHGLRVRSKPDATYHLGRRAITAVIATDTHWGTSRFIIDDSKGVDDSDKALFEVSSLLKPLPLKIDRLKRGQTKLNIRPSVDCLVYVENKNRKLFIRRGLNKNDGTQQKEVFILRRDGTIEGGIDWDYDTVTRVVAIPIDEKTLSIRGGDFTNIANRMDPGGKPSYWARNIRINRSKTLVEGVTHRVTGETEIGHPYHGFLSANRCAMVVLRNCVIHGRKFYQKIGNAGKPVAMGTYGYSANLVMDFRMIGCRMGNDIHDRSRWGVTGTNFMKNILLENCSLSRMDVHQGVSGSYIIRRCTLGHAGINAIGRGNLIIEDTAVHSNRLVSFREDYGSTWDGDVIIRNCRWIPPAGCNSRPVMINLRNDGMHDFGYPCSMPRVVRIDGLFVDDSKASGKTPGFFHFSDPGGPALGKSPFPYRLTEKLEVRGLKTASGLPPAVSTNPELVRAVTLIQN